MPCSIWPRSSARRSIGSASAPAGWNCDSPRPHRVLASRRADVDARETWFGETALMWAAAENHSDVVRALVGLGAKVDARSRVTAAPELEFPKSGGPNMPFARGGWTALMYASRDG